MWAKNNKLDKLKLDYYLEIIIYLDIGMYLHIIKYLNISKQIFKYIKVKWGESK